MNLICRFGRDAHMANDSLTALITGGTSGIGRATANKLLGEIYIVQGRHSKPCESEQVQSGAFGSPHYSEYDQPPFDPDCYRLGSRRRSQFRNDRAHMEFDSVARNTQETRDLRIGKTIRKKIQNP